jgi:hypothetical protein
MGTPVTRDTERRNQLKTDSLAFVLDYLRDGPAHLDTLYHDAWAQFAFSHEQVQDALRRLCVVARKRPQDGEVFVMRPANLYAIWWARRAPAHRFIGTASEGNAA